MADPVVTPPTWAPSLDRVGALIRARTLKLEQHRTGIPGEVLELGVFTDDTRPTGTEAMGVVGIICGEVQLAAGFGLKQFPADPDEQAALSVPLQQFYAAMSTCASYGSAAQIELAYYPEQVVIDRGPYQALKDEYERMLKAIALAGKVLADQGGGDGDPSTSDGGPGLAVFSTECGGYAAEARW